MRIALDVESVLADSNEAALQSTDKLDREQLLGNWNMSDEQWQVYLAVTDAVWTHKPEIIPPEEPCLDQYVQNFSDGHTVDIVTARMHVDEQIMWWLDHHGIEYDSFISTDIPKWEYDYDVWVDDNPEMFGECRLLLRNQPWNVDCPDTRSKSCDRIHSLAEVSDFL